MAAVLHSMIKLHSLLNEDFIDPRTKDFFLVDTLWRVPLLVIFYGYFVNVFGPKFMKKRQPYNLDRIVQIYDILQIIFNLYLFYWIFDTLSLKGYSFKCEPIDFSYTPLSIQVIRGIQYYFWIKIFDLLDTVFFILRKKQSHVSFLHVYHHGGMIIGTWACFKYLPGGHAIFVGLINTVVHIIMYTYYLLSSMKINIRSRWKKHITQLQMIQFLLLIWHFAQLLWRDCDYPTWVALVMVPQNLFMLVLFGEFYYNVYIVEKPASAAASTKIEENGVSAEIVPNGKLKEQ